MSGYTKHKPVVFDVGNSRFEGRIWKGETDYYLDFDDGRNDKVFGAAGLDKWEVAQKLYGSGYKVFYGDWVCWPPAPSLKALRAMIALVHRACADSDLAAYNRIKEKLEPQET